MREELDDEPGELLGLLVSDEMTAVAPHSSARTFGIRCSAARAPSTGIMPSRAPHTTSTSARNAAISSVRSLLAWWANSLRLSRCPGAVAARYRASTSSRGRNCDLGVNSSIIRSMFGMVGSAAKSRSDLIPSVSPGSCPGAYAWITILPTRSGYSRPNRSAAGPKAEEPYRWLRSMPSTSIRSRCSRAQKTSTGTSWRLTPFSDSPKPGMSIRITRKCSASASKAHLVLSHAFAPGPPPCVQIRAGPLPASL